MNAFNNYKLIHTLPVSNEGLEASLLLEESSREYVLKVKIKRNKHIAPTKTVLLTQLTTLHNYYQSLITPPIVAAPQVEFIEDTNHFIAKRSTPGTEKLNGRSMIKIQTHGEAGIVGQLFRQLHQRHTYGIPCFSAESDLGQCVQKIFRKSLSY